MKSDRFKFDRSCSRYRKGSNRTPPSLGWFADGGTNAHAVAQPNRTSMLQGGGADSVCLPPVGHAGEGSREGEPRAEPTHEHG